MSVHRYSKKVIAKNLGIIAIIIFVGVESEFFWRNFPFLLKFSCGVVALSTVVWLTLATVRAFLSQIRIFENGLEYRFGRRVRSCLWSDISGLKIQRYTWRNYHWLVFEIITFGDYKLYIGDELVLRVYATYNRQFALDWWIKEKTAERIAPSYEQRLQRGDKVTFDSVTLTKEQISSGNKKLLWSEVANSRWIDSLYITVYKRNTGFLRQGFVSIKIYTANMLNSHVLYYLIYSLHSRSLWKKADKSQRFISYKERTLIKGNYSRDYIESNWQ